MTKTVLASEHAVLDSNAYTGGGTDDTDALQFLLDKAVLWGGLKVIMDGAALVRGLRVHSNTTIECLNKDCGFFLKSGSNNSIIENFDVNYDEIINRNISLVGGTYNHNCKGQDHSTPGAEPGLSQRMKDAGVFGDSTMTIAMRFIGVENLLLRDLTIRNQRTFAMLAANWKRAVMENIVIDLPDKMSEQNQDGLHFWGPGQFLTLRNIGGDAGDDFIALAPDEHDKVSHITDVLIDGVFLDHADQGIRLLSRAEGRLDRVTIRNVTGTYRSFGFYINPWFPDKTSGSFGDIVFENIDLRPEAPNYHYRPPFLFQIGGRVEHLTLRNIKDHYSENQRVLFEVGSPFHDRSQDDPSQTRIEELTVDGLSILSRDGLRIAPFLIDAYIGRMVLRNADVSLGKTEETPLIGFGPHGQIGTLAVNGLLSDGLKKLTDAPENAVRETVYWNIHPEGLIRT